MSAEMRERKYIVSFTWKKYIGKDDAVTTNVLTVDAHSKEEALGKGLAQSRKDNKDGHLLIELVAECPISSDLLSMLKECIYAFENDIPEVIDRARLMIERYEGNARAVGEVSGGD